jgi:hypothetical protein
MFIRNFNQMLRTLPAEADGYDAFMLHISNKETVLDPTSDFLTRMTNYALARADTTPQPTPNANPKVLLAAFSITRFPIETLAKPEEPVQLALLNKAMNLVLAIGRIISEHNPGADDASDNLMPTATALLYLRALGEYRAAWTEWYNLECAAMRDEIQSAIDRMEAAIAGPDLFEPQLLVSEE